MYIDVSFPLASPAPQLDIRVHRHSNCTGLHACYAMLVPRLSRRDITLVRWYIAIIEYIYIYQDSDISYINYSVK